MEEIEAEYTRVSSILSIFQAYAHVPKDKLLKAQEVGTEVHEAIEEYYCGRFKPLGPRKSPYLDSFLVWAENTRASPILLETRFYDPQLMITGKIDLLANIDGEIVLVDFKTGSWSHPEIWRMQGTFYKYLLAVNGKETIPEKMLFVQLLRTGDSPILMEFPFRSEDGDACLSAWKLYHWFQGATKDLTCS